jgi:hypothetical protein
MDPVMKLFVRSKVFIFDAVASGIVPESLLDLRFKIFSLGCDRRPEGIDPSNKFWDKSSIVKFRFAMLGGIVPVSDPICIVKRVKLGRDPIESGMVPPRVTANSIRDKWPSPLQTKLGANEQISLFAKLAANPGELAIKSSINCASSGASCPRELHECSNK